ncbi:peptidylprolyl isomerase [Candidatus Tisiphia endosymbiont of Nemotelus uliginosus]|uniref:peptidylprolyl isomerase n=1 Tax=Candidatus Tisiphia endosymbiont of Nemotelus uliginosus TaxID=3077926 RepID=UPI0035C8D7C9
MLNNIRKTADSFVMKILLGMIIFAFVGWGIKDVLQSNKNFDLVKFTYASNISQDDFLKAKSEQIRIIQSQTKVALNEEDIKQLHLDDLILKKLINNNILNYLASYYDLDLSNNTMLQFIKEAPDFKNQQGLFDINLFKNFLKNSYINEAKYLAEVKEQILKNTVISIFLENLPVPNVMVQNIVNYMAEIREVDLLQINLKQQPKGLIIPAPTQEQLEDLYQKNKSLFALPEQRSIAYIKITNDILPKQIHISQEELLNFYLANKEEFNNKNFSEVQKQVEQLLQKQQFDILLQQFIRELGDEVAAGSNLVEISKKYKLPLHNMNYISYSEALKNPDISQNADSIFKLTDGELSYPLEEKDSFILVAIKEIKPNQIQELALVKEQLKKLWREEYLKDYNLQKIQALATDYVLGKKISIPGIAINKAAHFIRSELRDNKHLPEDLLLSIFQTTPKSATPVFQSQDIAYFAYIKSVKTDHTKSQVIQEKNKDNIVNNIKNGVIEELIHYLIKHNKMTISHT